jgi:hypothetical protein
VSRERTGRPCPRPITYIARDTDGLFLPPLPRYWFGAPDAEGRNLATCIWHSRDHAVRGSKGQWHKRAARATASLYSYWKIERLRLTVREGAAGIDFAEWVD